jgi:glycine/D-amino acid oxidase-like deaminating enzyme
MVATEPIPQTTWDGIGLADREVFADHRHVIIYGQRTADDRIAFGGRGAPYHWGSRIRPRFDRDARVFDDLRATLTELLPQLEGVRFTHAWGGPLGIARDWHPSLGLDASTGLGWAGGYVGDGVAASNLAGRTLADLVGGRHTSLTALPWVGHRSRQWEPEPLRWLGVNAGLRLGVSADREEERTGRPAARARLLDALTGH